MRNTSKKAAKKRTPKHPQKTRPVKPESYIQTVSRMLTVRRMFSLLHYRVILARKGPNVKDFFLSFSEYSAPGLGIVDSGKWTVRVSLREKLGICPQGGRPSRAQNMCYRFCPAPLGIVLWCSKLGICRIFGHCEPVLLSGVAIS